MDVLLVEDNDADAEMTIRALRRGGMAGNLSRVRDGAEALQFVFREGMFQDRRGGQPKLILLDVKTPRLGGLELMRRLKSVDEVKYIPVVVLSSSAEPQDIVESYRLGVNSYLVKPLDFTGFADLVSLAGTYWTVANRWPT